MRYRKSEGRRIVSVLLLAALGLTVGLASAAYAARGGNSGREFGTVYVTSQGLYYDTQVTAETLPPHGSFQLLEDGPNGPQTEYGPGDPGYLGGRWWRDENGNGQMDEGDRYFLCPLFGPGRETP